MIKNKPITARVSTGLFNKKKGVTEPLLNVGQAGVHGNNKTKDIPSPSKMRGYSMKASPFKQEKQPNTDSPYSDETPVETAIVTQGAGTQIVNKGKEITKAVNTDTYDGSGGYAPNDEWDAFLKTDAGKEYIKKNTKQVGTGNFEPDTTTNVPGETKTKLSDLEVKGRRGAVQNWEVNAQRRKMRHLSDDISDYTKKVGKYTDNLSKHTGKDGKPLKGHERRFRKAQANLDEYTRNMKAAQGQYDTYTRQVAAGAKGSSGDTFGVKTKATKSDIGDLAAQDNFLRTGTFEKQTESTPNPADNKKKKKTKDVDANAKKKTSQFFKGKTPLKMKYFK